MLKIYCEPLLAVDPSGALGLLSCFPKLAVAVTWKPLLLWWLRWQKGAGPVVSWTLLIVVLPILSNMFLTNHQGFFPPSLLADDSSASPSLLLVLKSHNNRSVEVHQLTLAQHDLVMQ